MNSSTQRNDLSGSTHVRICLRDLCVTLSIGVHPWERHAERPQRVVVNAVLYVRSSDYLYQAADGGSIVDYDPVRRYVLGWPALGHVDYIETLMVGLLDVCFMDNRVEACELSITKPDIFIDAKEAGVEIFMTRADYLSGKNKA